MSLTVRAQPQTVMLCPPKLSWSLKISDILVRFICCTSFALVIDLIMGYYTSNFSHFQLLTIYKFIKNLQCQAQTILPADAQYIYKLATLVLNYLIE